MKKFNKAKKHMRMLFIISTAIVMIASLTIIFTLEYVFAGMRIEEELIRGSWGWVSAVVGMSTIIVAAFFSFITGKIIFQPIDSIIDGMERLSSGDYSARIDFGENSGMQSVADGFNSLASELEHTELVRSDFINNFSHEIKTPLSSVKGLIVLMKSGRVPKEKEREYLEIIEEEADRLSMMTTNILNLSKIQNQKIIVNKEEYNLSEQLRASTVIFERRWMEKEITMSLDVGEDIKIVAAEELMRQVFVNLIDNALKFGHRGSEISISAVASDDGISVSITNEGPEIPADEAERIFHKFYRGESAGRSSGNGIGLSIVKSIVEMHGGKVKASSKDGKTTFTVSISG